MVANRQGYHSRCGTVWPSKDGAVSFGNRDVSAPESLVLLNVDDRSTCDVALFVSKPCL